MRYRLALFAAVAVLFLVASTAQADILPPPPDFKMTVELTPTRYGASLGAGGWSAIARTDATESFSLHAFAKLDGVELTVYGLGETDEWFLVGEFKVDLGDGGLDIVQGKGNEPWQLFPVTKLRKLAVYYGKFPVLSGSFELVRD